MFDYTFTVPVAIFDSGAWVLLISILVIFLVVYVVKLIWSLVVGG